MIWDLLAIAGVVMIAIGLGWFWQPLAVIWIGAVAIVAAVIGARQRKRGSR